ncbi:MAG: c-type cytochrome [Chloroflexi bacterium]|nr:c-type cytochrome [Chloroflexota bacterium]MCI0576177.1 c-type cytochrome [Chloroflexota bacterium]MCI0648970.1 c-type cytochrome [Chloroflexota bacterium]MCI0728186.1 c-type cytochrome [Chloroflexota bacterium]
MIGILITITVGLLFSLLALRVRRSERALFKWAGSILSGLLAVVLFLLGGIALVGLIRIEAPAARPASNLQANHSPEQIARGERLAHLCTTCHSSTGDLPLDGTVLNFIEAPFGTIAAPNLTAGGNLDQWTDGEIGRAIREGIGRDGNALVIMPSQYLRHLSDQDVEALVAYLRSQPAVEHEVPETRLNFLGLVAVGTGLFPTAVQSDVPESTGAPPAGPTVDYGEYLVNFSMCRDCHGVNLMGGDPEGFVPVGPPLPPLVAAWSAEEFITTIRTGVDPDGQLLDGEQMPWATYSATFTDDELLAIYEYLRVLAAEGSVE